MAIDACSLNINENLQETDKRGTVVFACSAYITAVGNKLNEDIPLHWHDEFEVLFINEGTLILNIAAKTYTLYEGCAMFINSGTLMSAKSKHDKNCEVKSIVFSGRLLADANSAIEQRYIRPLISCGSLPCLAMCGEDTELIVRAFVACCEERFGYEIEVRECLMRLIFNIVSTNIKIIESDAIPCTDRDRLKLMIEYIRDNYSEDISVKDIANVCSISERECFRCFKGMMGASPKKHLMSHRISVASGLLLNTDSTVAQISTECGFDSPGYFSAMFKRLMGTTPLQYRKTNDHRRF